MDAQTVILANSILLHLVASPTGHMRFRDGTHVGGWLEGAESVAQNRQQLGVLIGETEKEYDCEANVMLNNLLYSVHRNLLSRKASFSAPNH